MLSQLSERFTTGRVVALLTPTVIAPLAGSIAVLAAKYGMDVDAGQLQAVFIAGITAALGTGALWLKGWQDWEKRQDETPTGVSNDIRLEETMAPRSIAVAESPAAGNGSVDVADAGIEDADVLEEEMEADGFEEDLDLLDEDLDPAEEEELLGVGEE